MKIQLAVVLLAAAVGLGACGNEPSKQQAPDQNAEAPAPAPTLFFQTNAFQDAVVRANGMSFTVERAGERRQGLSILPLEGGAPVRIDFAVQGDGARVSYYRGGEWTELPAQESYGLRLGAGGAFHILIVPAAGQSATVNVTGTTTCRGAPPETCPTL
jgi:hypothetical protein